MFLHAVIASASLGAVEVDIISICDQPGVKVDKETAQIIYNLAKPNTESLRYAIKRAVVHFLHLNKHIQISPHVVEAIVAVTREK